MRENKPAIAVVGPGRMGNGISQVFAYTGFRVDLIDIKQRPKAEAQTALAAAASQIQGNLEFLGSLGLLPPESVESIARRINYHERKDAAAALAGAHVVFEAVPEVLEIKQAAFTEIASAVAPDTLISSTTSTFLVNELAGYVPNPERFMNTHWLNPAYLIPIVEVSPGRETSPLALEKMIGLLESAGKVPIKCSASPGFIVPRIQTLVMNEAARLIEEGVATPAEVDKASRLGFGLRFAILGLLEFIDWGGGDILYYAANYLQSALQDQRFAPPAIISSNMREGRIGMKSGQGFYDFSQVDVLQYQRDTIKKFVDLLQHLGLMALPEIQ